MIVLGSKGIAAACSILFCFVLTELVKEVLKLDEEIKKLAEELYQHKSVIVMGRGFNYATCLEGALVNCYVHSQEGGGRGRGGRRKEEEGEEGVGRRGGGGERRRRERRGWGRGVLHVYMYSCVLEK